MQVMLDKMYWVYSEDHKQFIDTAIGYEQLAKVLGISVHKLKYNLTLQKHKRNKYIKDSKGMTRFILSEDDIRKVARKNES